MSSAIIDGTIHNNVRFVNSREEADCEVRWDEMDYKDGHWLYFYHGYLVAVKKASEPGSSLGGEE